MAWDEEQRDKKNETYSEKTGLEGGEGVNQIIILVIYFILERDWIDQDFNSLKSTTCLILML